MDNGDGFVQGCAFALIFVAPFWCLVFVLLAVWLTG